MRKLIALLLVAGVVYLAFVGHAKISDNTKSSGDAFVCGVAESTRSALKTGGDAAKAAAGLIRDNTAGLVHDLAQRVVDAPDNAAARKALEKWVNSACGPANS